MEIIPFLQILAFIGLASLLKDPRTEKTSICMALFLLFKCVLAFTYTDLQLHEIALICIVLDGITGFLILRIGCRLGWFLAILYSFSITCTFYLGARGEFPLYRPLMDMVVCLQLCALVISNGLSQPRILGSASRLRVYEH